MNLIRLKSTLLHSPTKKPILRTTLTLPILETHLNQCQNLNHFNQILSQTILTGLIGDTFAASRLIKFSAAFRFVHVDYSLRVFTLVDTPNGFTWNTLMRAYVQRKCPQKAFSLYKSMLERDFCPDNYTYPVLVQSCALRLSQFEGKQIHCHVFKTGFDSDVYVGNTLINMYAVCGNLVDARKLFDESPSPDSVSWNSILSGYVQTERVDEAKDIYDRMPTKNTIASNSMIALFGSTGRVSEARRLFDEMPQRDMVSWSALASCLEQNGMHGEALSLFSRMNENGVTLDEVAAITALSACARLSSTVEIIRQIHCLATKVGIESYVNLRNALIHSYSSSGALSAAERVFGSARDPNQITWNSMLSGYLRSGSVDEAEALFGSMPERDSVSWGAMMSGYAQLGRFSETLALFREMQGSGVRPDGPCLVSVVSACTRLSALELGKQVHDYIRRNGLELNPVLGTAVVDMYMKSGCVEEALEAFGSMGRKGISAWNALILGLATNGLEEKSLEAFSEMKGGGVEPNEVTFVAVLGACRHVGMVEEGRRIFDSMRREHSIEPGLRHYNCLVDLLGRAGRVGEAEEVVGSMPMEPDAATWGALLGACGKHGAHEAAERVGRRAVELRPDHDGIHVLFSNIRASRGNFGGAAAVREAMTWRGVVKTPGRSAIEEASRRRHDDDRDRNSMIDEEFCW